jgi:hypothetical protein
MSTTTRAFRPSRIHGTSGAAVGIATLSMTTTLGLARASAERACAVDATETIRSGTPARRQARSMRRS